MNARIQSGKIDIGELIEASRNEESGALVTFQGTVRRTTGDVVVSSLNYEAYQEMALKKLREIMDNAVEKYGLNDVNVIHRIGNVPLKEDSVAICVSSPHRDEAFRACRYIIDTIKTDVPIWKQDITGTGEKHWH